MLCAGKLAEWYEAHGGHVDWFGKPYPAVYKKCREMFGELGLKVPESESVGEQSLVPRSGSGSSSQLGSWEGNMPKIAAIGDSLHTDIAGARAAGIHAVLTTGGILAAALGIVHGELPERERLAALCAEEQAEPDTVIPAFRW